MASHCKKSTCCDVVVVAGTQGPKGDPGDLEWFTSEATTCPDYGLSILVPKPLTDPDRGVVVQTRGVGALMRTIPDGTEVGGDCRGEDATDWQASRTASDQVASGTASTLSGGFNNTASSTASTVSGGSNNTASGNSSTCGGGLFNEATGLIATVSGGILNVASANYSTCGGGRINVASGNDSTCGGGNSNAASGEYSTCGGGELNIASGVHSTCGGGYGNIASGQYSCIPGGLGLDASYEASCAVGKFNVDGEIVENDPDTERIFMVGYGNNNVFRENLLSVTQKGNLYLKGSIQLGPADFAEFFESESGDVIPPGTPVVFVSNTKKIKPASDGDVPFGVISSDPAFVGNSAAEQWYGKYELDANGKIVYEQIQEEYSSPVTVEEEVERMVRDVDEDTLTITVKKVKETIERSVSVEYTVKDEDGNVIGKEMVPKTETKTRTVTRPKLSLDFDPTLPYTSRDSRPEWNIVGLLGVVKVLPDSPVAPSWIKLDNDLYLIR